MAGKMSNRTKWVLRGVAAAVLLVLLLGGANSFALAYRLRPDFIADHTGVVEPDKVPGQLDIVLRNHAANLFGNDVVFSFRTAAGQVSPPAFPATFPLYPGSKTLRSAVYKQPIGGTKPDRELRGAVYRVPASSDVAIEWYRKALMEHGWKVYRAPVAVQPAALQATKDGGAIARIEVEPSAGGVKHSVIGVYVDGE